MKVKVMLEVTVTTYSNAHIGLIEEVIQCVGRLAGDQDMDVIAINAYTEKVKE